MPAVLEFVVTAVFDEDAEYSEWLEQPAER